MGAYQGPPYTLPVYTRSLGVLLNGFITNGTSTVLICGVTAPEIVHPGVLGVLATAEKGVTGYECNYSQMGWCSCGALFQLRRTVHRCIGHQSYDLFLTDCASDPGLAWKLYGCSFITDWCPKSPDRLFIIFLLPVNIMCETKLWSNNKILTPAKSLVQIVCSTIRRSSGPSVLLAFVVSGTLWHICVCSERLSVHADAPS